MTDPIAVEPREDYRIWLRYSDGAEGRSICRTWQAAEYSVHGMIEPVLKQFT